MCGRNSTKKLLKLAVIFITAVQETVARNDDIFKADIGDQMTIGLSDTGYKSVKLTCGSNSMLISLETDDNFDGVIYTRGNFYDRKSPCFLDSDDQKKGQRFFSIKFPLDECNTVKNGELYSNILVLQHDKELIMPGDAAFHLECDYGKPRDVTVNANLHNEKPVKSKITLTDADPSFKDVHKRDKKSTIANSGDTVVLTADVLKKRKEEL